MHDNQSLTDRQTTISRQATFVRRLHPDVANKFNAGSDLALKLRLVNESITTAQ